MRSLLLLALALVAGCASRPDARPAHAPAAPAATTVPATWSLTPSEYRGQTGARLVFECPPNPQRYEVGAVWGSDVYSDDSALCAAAVHAGVLTFERGGRVAVTMQPGRDHYEGLVRNGVESSEWDSWGGSFAVATY